jgi:hypothetical protein
MFCSFVYENIMILHSNNENPPKNNNKLSMISINPIIGAYTR